MASGKLESHPRTSRPNAESDLAWVERTNSLAFAMTRSRSVGRPALDLRTLSLSDIAPSDQHQRSTTRWSAHRVLPNKIHHLIPLSLSTDAALTAGCHKPSRSGTGATSSSPYPLTPTPEITEPRRATAGASFFVASVGGLVI